MLAFHIKEFSKYFILKFTEKNISKTMTQWIHIQSNVNPRNKQSPQYQITEFKYAYPKQSSSLQGWMFAGINVSYISYSNLSRLNENVSFVNLSFRIIRLFNQSKMNVRVKLNNKQLNQLLTLFAKLNSIRKRKKI